MQAVSLFHMEKAITRHYPEARTSNEILSYYINVITQEYHIERQAIMYAHSVCADDVNSIKYPAVLKTILGPFGLGGLDGYPFTGVTGLAAYAHHIPEHGAAFIFFGPHLGISEEGELGQIKRHGQHKNSGACGAAIIALQNLRKNAIDLEHWDPDDHQLHVLQTEAYNHKDRILSAENPLRELTDVIYEATEQKILEYIRRVRFPCELIFLLGGIILNTGSMFEDYLSVQSFRIIDAATKAIKIEQK